MDALSRRCAAGFAVFAVATLASCSAPPKAEPTGRLMDRTTAGANRCIVTKSHTRPFVIEWDATDLAGFEAKAEHDVVFVRYQGCNLTVLDCADGSVRGRLGNYRPTEWTAGGIEGFEMTTEQDLYAQLPLGASSLVGRLQQGETLRLRYYVSGVATASRDAAYRGDLPTRASCAGATHFVHSYNLGAFELASGARTKIAGAKQELGVVKRGGDIDSCRDEVTRATKKCSIPIRITLREIEEGTGPTTKATAAPAGITSDQMLEAGKLRSSALRKLMGGDGVGCLKDLERATEVDPDRERADVQCQLHGQCTMRAGKCDLGKELLRACYGRLYGNTVQPDAIAAMVKSQADNYCAK